MTLAEKAASVFGYRVFPTSFLAILTYIALFIALIVTDVLPSVPNHQKQGGLDLKEAYEDLRHITAKPHPYNSHANDHARTYILNRLRLLEKEYDRIQIADDLRSNGSWAGTYGVYFEGTNILVRIDGNSSSNRGGVLFSAHYDSVSTAPGATDDGMGVATLIQLVKYFAENKMERTAVFNINNGEEDWLNGAHAFLEHPWSALTDTFLNLEGAAAGGRPILFRATSTPSVRSFRNHKLVPHPHANVLSSDAFSRGLIRSGTDFSVYTTPGPRPAMDGLDLAFYKGRSRYHTKYDAAQYTLGGEKSLWNMMETARGVGIGLLSVPFDEKRDSDGDVDLQGGSPPIYFDLFKSVLIVFPMSKLLTFNIFTLVIGPVLLILLVLSEIILVKRREKAITQEEHVHPTRVHTPPLLQHRSTQSARAQEHPHLGDLRPSHVDENDDGIVGHDKPSAAGHWIHIFWRHVKFWAALVVVIGLQLLLMAGYVLFNPFAIYAYPYTVLFSFLTLAYLGLVFTLTFPSSLPFYYPKLHALYFVDAVPPPAQQQKHTIFLHLYLFTWILLVLSTLGITKLHPGIGSGYLITSWNLCVGVGCLFAAIEGLVLSSLWSKSGIHAEEREERYEELEGEESGGARPHRPHTPRHVTEDPNADENTPLIYRQHTRHDGHLLPPRRHLSGEEEEGGGVGTLATWWWIPQFLVSVPIPITLLAHVTMLVLDAMPQTLADGASASSVYTLTALPAILLVLPLAPFAYKLRPFRPLTLFVLLIFLLSTLSSWLLFPFSVQDPLKLYFQQSVVFSPEVVTAPWPTSSGNASQLVTCITALSGPKRYLKSAVLPYLPSSQQHGKEIQCAPDPVKIGLTKCQWESGAKLVPTPGFANLTKTPEDDVKGTKWETGEFFKAHVTKTGPSTARIQIQGKNTRSCRVYFDSGPIFRYSVLSSENGIPAPTGKGMQKGYEVPQAGVKEVRLWSRTWEKEFIVDVGWGVTITKDDGGQDTPVPTDGMKGRVGCEWNEYESALVDSGPWDTDTVSRAKIPALEEVLAFLPEWAVATKASDGLVEAWAPFTL